jgi:YjbE family integral membrane protein
MGLAVASSLGSLASEIGPWVLPIAQIVWIDLVLSGDNAVVIALACRSLPPKQRTWGIILGAGVAIGLRIAFAGIISQLLAIPFLKLVGGLLLLWIAVKLLVGEEGGGGEASIASPDQLWRAVGTIAMADALMSLDNVIAVAAVAKGSLALIAFGIALSIPLIVFGSKLVLALIGRFPMVVWFGAALLGWISGELIASEMTLASTLQSVATQLGIGEPTLHHIVALAATILVLLVGWFLKQNGERAKV